LLASEYGWTKDYILKRVYPMEAFDFADRIKQRKNTDYLIQLSIAHNPYAKEPTKLFNELEKAIESESNLSGDSIDRNGLNRLKNMLKKSKNIGVK